MYWSISFNGVELLYPHFYMSTIKPLKAFLLRFNADVKLNEKSK